MIESCSRSPSKDGRQQDLREIQEDDDFAGVGSRLTGEESNESLRLSKMLDTSNYDRKWQEPTSSLVITKAENQSWNERQQPHISHNKFKITRNSQMQPSNVKVLRSQRRT